MRRFIQVAAALAVAGLPASLSAQSSTSHPAWRNGRLSAEALYSHYWLDGANGAGRTGADGVGGRLLWHFGPAAEVGMPGAASRLALGAFAVYTPAQDRGFTTWHFGGEADYHLLSTPAFGRIDPVISLGAGAFRTDLSGPPVPSVALANRTNTSFALSPAVGVRLPLYRQLGIRTDVRDVMVFHDGTRHNPELSAGLALSF